MAEQKSGETTAVDEYLASNLDSVDRAENLVLEVARGAGFEEDDLHKIGMSIRESVVNAVVHGNRYHRGKQVHLVVSTTPDRLVVRIQDQGNGFDMSKLPDPLAEPNLLQQSGRGIFLIRAFVDEFQVRRLEPAGTEVTLVKYKSAIS